MLALCKEIMFMQDKILLLEIVAGEKAVGGGVKYGDLQISVVFGRRTA